MRESISDDELAAAVDANYWASFSMLAEACAGAVLRRDDVLAVSTGLPVPMLNQGFIKKPLGGREEPIRDMVEFYDAAGVPFILRVREGVDPEAEKSMEAMGLPYSDTVPGMAMFPIGDPPPPCEGLSIETVADQRSLARYQRVLAEGFGMPLALAERLMAPAVLQVPGFESYLGVMDGEAVGTSSMYAGNGIAGVYNVATLASHRRQGIGEAMTWRAVTQGHEDGCTTATLQASVMGKPVYERMGFRTVAPYRTFHRRAKEGS